MQQVLADLSLTYVPGIALNMATESQQMVKIGFAGVPAVAA